VEEAVVRQSLKHHHEFAFLGLLALAGLLGCSNHRALNLQGLGEAAQPSSEPPPAPREFRAAWIATVANIDWPSTPGLSVAAQKAEAQSIILQARALGLNALILQVRPGADALYASAVEPWSEYLTGTQGKAPEPFYDPLAFWIQEAHRAGLELHAWFNPYRARQSSSRSPLAPNHISNTHPELVKTYGDQLWLDPGEPGAVKQSIGVILDVVRRYDVDGVHIDDYFYPYPIKDALGQQVPFPDEPSWQAFLARGGALTREDWRRHNVDKFVESVYCEVHRTKPQVRVGVSPFGLGQPDRRPAGITGFSQFDELYADVELWLEQGWLDYLAPQLYWKRGSTNQPFLPLLAYWRAQNPKGRHVWPGLFTSQTGATTPWQTEEITGQIQLTRSGENNPGHAHFSMVALQKNYGGIREGLADIYAGPALIPASPWLGGEAPPPPSVCLRHDAADPTTVRVEMLAGDPSCLLAVWGRYGSEWRFFTLTGGIGSIPARFRNQPMDLAYASSIGRTGLESTRTAVKDLRN
jgi:uncharacterized lipoprotein YddW (UPF0748 family)